MADGLEGIFSDHKEFASFVRHELKRSERYCSFVSMLTVRIDRLSDRLKKKYPADTALISDYFARIAEIVRSSVRSTDVVSDIKRDTMGLLLIETPQEGAVAVANRLSGNLSEFLERLGGIAPGVDLAVDIASYPGRDNAAIRRMLDEFVN